MSRREVSAITEEREELSNKLKKKVRFGARLLSYVAVQFILGGGKRYEDDEQLIRFRLIHGHIE